MTATKGAKARPGGGIQLTDIVAARRSCLDRDSMCASVHEGLSANFLPGRQGPMPPDARARREGRAGRGVVAGDNHNRPACASSRRAAAAEARKRRWRRGGAREGRHRRFSLAQVAKPGGSLLQGRFSICNF